MHLLCFMFVGMVPAVNLNSPLERVDQVVDGTLEEWGRESEESQMKA
jgi:hypothetical protein